MPNLDTIRREFIEGSVIAPDVFDLAIDVIPDIDYNQYAREVESAPIAEALGWRYSRFTREAKTETIAAGFISESGEIWQLKVFGEDANGKTGKYLAPKGIGDKPYFPPVPYRIVLAIALKYDVKPPEHNESFWSWIIDHPVIPIAVTEGGKKALTLISLGIPAIALYGCRCGAKRKDKNGCEVPLHLIPELVSFVGKRKVVLAFDRDTNPKAKTAVTKGIYSLSIAISKAGGKPRVATWDARDGKGIDDVASNLGSIFAAGLIESAVSFEAWKNRDRAELGDRVDRTINERFLTLETLAIPETAQLICIKSPKGTAKTETIAEIVARATARGTPVLSIGHRVKLQTEAANRFGLDYRTERSELADLLGYALCIDSLHPRANPPFNPSRWEGAIVLLDEIEQVIWHLLSSPTCQSNRVVIVETLRDLLRMVIGTGGKIIISDADLSPLAIDFLKSLIGVPVETWVVENRWKRENKRCLTVYEKKTTMLSALLAHIENGGRPYIVTGSRKKESKYSTQNLETHIKTQFPERSTLRVDSESVSDRTHPAYKATDNLSATLTRFDAVIASPTLETGVSIDGNHFDSVWCFATGSQTVNGVCQSIERVRADVPRHLYAEKRHNNTIGDGSDNPRELLRGEKKKSAFTFRQLSELDSIAQVVDGERGELTVTWAQYAAIINGQSRRYAPAIIEKLESEDYQVERYDPNGESHLYADEKTIETLVTLTREENLEREREAIANAPDLTDAEFDRLNEKLERTESERYTLRKGKLRRRYLTEDITPETVKRDSEGWFNELTLHYFLTVGKPFLKARDRRKVKALGEASGGKVFTPDLNRSTLTAKVACLEFLEIDRFLDPERTFTNDDLKEWWEKTVLPYRRDIKTLTGITIGANDTPIRFAQRLTGKFGLKLTCIARIGPRGSRTRVYRLTSIDPDGRGEIFARWCERDNRPVSTDSINPLLRGAVSA
jgi:hypothetical protein